jgi:short-subunit dehydrogenase
MRELNGKRALITGGGRGIGGALAVALAERGARVCLADLDLDAARATAERLRRAGHAATAHHVDVSDDASIELLRGELGAGAPVDLLVNNAGIVAGGPFADVAVETHRRTTAINLVGLMAVTHVFLPDLVAQPEAHVVNIVSASAFLGLPYGASYAASKWGALGFSESLRLELRALGHRHVHVTAICPGYVDTGMFSGARNPPLTPFLSPEALARRTVRAIERNASIVRTPWTVHLARLSAVLPTPVFDRITAAFGVNTSMRDWEGH